MEPALLNRRQFVAGIAATTAISASAPAQTASTNAARLADDLDGLGVRTAIVLQAGETILAHGDVAAPIPVASIRKSVLSGLLGIAISEGKLALHTNLDQLAIKDDTPLTPSERQATIADLITARSGIYLPSEGASGRPDRLPARGSHPPGTYWFYNNWDFNVLGEIYQLSTGEGLFTALEHRLAEPLGWQDFDPLRHARWSYDLSRSRFPAYRFEISTRDLARFGQLYLAGGRWRDRPIIPESWISDSVRAHARPGGPIFDGYGYMWPTMTDENAARVGLPRGTYSAIGAGGRYLTIVPEHQIVIALQPHEPTGPQLAPVSDQRLYLPWLKKVVAHFS